jgi:hypothetical protein
MDIRDVEAVKAIRPVDAALYLRAKGWEQRDVHLGRAAVWVQRVGEDDFEALLPMDVGLRDYALRMGDLLGVLSAAERRSQWQIYNDLLTITCDVTRIRISDAELSDGTLPIEEHAQIAQKARDLCLAAACAATERRSVWHKRKPAQAIDQVRRIRIGQSERGSYIVTVISRITPLLHAANEQLFEVEIPFERKVTQMLADSLQALDRASEQAALTQQLAAFDAAVPDGVNANLCDAVVGLWGGEETQRNLEFSFTWSPARPVVVGQVQRVAFSSDRIPVIREAGRQMRERAPLPEFELAGPIVKLEREEGAPLGKVKVIGILDDRQVGVWLELEDARYHEAVQAHDQGKTLRVFGTLTREGRSFVLQNPQNLTAEQE